MKKLGNLGEVFQDCFLGGIGRRGRFKIYFLESVGSSPIENTMNMNNLKKKKERKNHKGIGILYLLGAFAVIKALIVLVIFLEYGYIDGIFFLI